MGFFAAHCRSCGTDVRRTTRYCPQCGAASPAKAADKILDLDPTAGGKGTSFKIPERFKQLAGLLLLGCIAFGIFWWANLPLTPEEQAKVEHEQQSAKAAVDAAVAASRKPEWDEVVVRDARRNDFDLFLYYRFWPAGFSVVERDTKELVRALLHELRLQWPPVKRDSLRIHVFARIYQRGETGKLLIHDVGTTSYLGTEDVIRYERPK
jgi:hypothetical protein